MPAESIESLERYRVVAIRNCTLAMVCLGTVALARAVSLGDGLIAAALLVAMGLAAGILVRLHRGASHVWAGNASIGVLFSIVLVANTTAGGFLDPTFAYFTLVPVAAALLVGNRAAIGWGLAIAGVAVGFWALSESGFEFPHWIPEEERAEQALFHRVVLTAGLVVMSVGFVRGHDRVARALVDMAGARSRESERLQLLQIAAVAANEAATTEDAIRDCAERVSAVTGWPLAMYWVPNPDVAGQWHFESVWTSDGTGRFDALVEQSRTLRFAPGELALGQIVETAEPRYASGPTLAADGSPRGSLALAAGLQSVAAIPIVCGRRAVALLEFWSTDDGLIDPSTVEILVQVGRQLGRVAERLGLEDGLRRAQKLESIAQLAAGIAHEINNPMTYVRSNLGALESELAEMRSHAALAADDSAKLHFDECEEMVGDAIEGAERTIAIVRDILEFSLDSREPAEVTEVSQVVQASLRLCRPRLRDEIAVEVDEEPGLAVVCNASQLQQVLVNLIVNAVQAMPEGGRLGVVTERVGSGVAIAVTDEGEGIPPDARERIFDPFYTTKVVGEGTGLGLYVSHGIVAAHHGEIRVEPRSPRGTSFVVVLPEAL